MKNTGFILLLLVTALSLHGQVSNDDKKNISALIDSYSLARERSDTLLLKSILTEDIDQLVSTGEWRNGIRAAIQGMLRSTAGSPGKRTLKIEKIKKVQSNTAIVDCHYELQNQDSTSRKMWSTFIIAKLNGRWKISGIRNMLPTAN